MRNFAISLVIFTTIYLFIFTICSQVDVTLKWMYILFIFGNALVIWMVYAVLVDNYKTQKTFKDWYEDKPKKE